MPEQLRTTADAGEDQARGLLFQQRAQRLFLKGSILVGITDHQRVAALAADFLRALDDRGEIAVADVRHDDADIARVAQA